MRLANLWTIKWTNTCNNLEVFFICLLLFRFLFLPDLSCIYPSIDLAVLLILSYLPLLNLELQ